MLTTNKERCDSFLPLRNPAPNLIAQCTELGDQTFEQMEKDGRASDHLVPTRIHRTRKGTIFQRVIKTEISDFKPSRIAI